VLTSSWTGVPNKVAGQCIFATFSNAAVHQWLAVDWLVVWGIYLFIYFLFAHFIIFQARPVQSLRKVH